MALIISIGISIINTTIATTAASLLDYLLDSGGNRLLDSNGDRILGV